MKRHQEEQVDIKHKKWVKFIINLYNQQGKAMNTLKTNPSQFV